MALDCGEEISEIPGQNPCRHMTDMPTPRRESQSASELNPQPSCCQARPPLPPLTPPFYSQLLPTLLRQNWWRMKNLCPFKHHSFTLELFSICCWWRSGKNAQKCATAANESRRTRACQTYFKLRTMRNKEALQQTHILSVSLCAALSKAFGRVTFYLVFTLSSCQHICIKFGGYCHRLETHWEFLSGGFIWHEISSENTWGGRKKNLYKMKIGWLVHKGFAWGVLFYDQSCKVGKQDCTTKHTLPESSWVTFYGW